MHQTYWFTQLCLRKIKASVSNKIGRLTSALQLLLPRIHSSSSGVMNWTESTVALGDRALCYCDKSPLTSAYYTYTKCSSKCRHFQVGARLSATVKFFTNSCLPAHKTHTSLMLPSTYLDLANYIWGVCVCVCLCTRLCVWLSYLCHRQLLFVLPQVFKPTL